MYCKYCKQERGIKSSIKKFNLVTLDCNHSFKDEIPEIPKELVLLPKEEESTSLAPPNQSLEVIEDDFKDIISSDGRVPYNFQKDGIRFIEEANFRGIIADEMGLGKTIQALLTLKRNPKETLPALILVKSSLKLQWFGEIVRWCGVKGFLPQIITDGKIPPVPGFQIYIASHDIIRKFTKKSKKTETSKYGMEITKEIKENPFFEFPFKTVIIDEAQRITNPTTARTDAIFRICEGKQNVILLSGTPFKNNIFEYYYLLNLLKPDLFPSIDYFERNFVKMGWIGSSYKPIGLKDPEFFKQMTKNFVIRRERTEVLPDLPTINRVFHHVDFESEKLKKQYQAAEDEMIRRYEEEVRNKSPQEILGIMAVVRHLVGLNKIKPTVEKIIEFLTETDRKLLVFAHHQDVMEMIHLMTTNYCLDNDLEPALKFHSGLNDNERDDMIRKFRDSNCRVMVVSTLAGGEGLNLQFCSDAIFVERQWNPANEEQAEGRMIRIGQEATQVNAIYMIVSSSMDEWFTELVEQKRRAFKSTMLGVDNIEMGSLLKDLMDVIAAKGRKRTVRGF